MGGLQWRCLRFALFASCVASATGALAGSIRLLPWFFSPDVPLRVTLPFARALLSTSCEVGLLVGLPLGFVLAGVRSVNTGEQRALEALGVSPARMALSVWKPAIALPTILVLSCSGVDPGAGVPGRFASSLLVEGGSACSRSAKPATFWIPMLDVTWLCFPNAEPLVVAPLPRSGGRAWFSARSLTLSDDLSAISLEDFSLASRPDGDGRTVHLRVSRAEIANLRQWGQPVLKEPWLRIGSLTVSMVLALPLALWIALQCRVRSRLLAGGGAVLLGIALYRAVRGMDAASEWQVGYWLLPLAAPFAIGLVERSWTQWQGTRWRRMTGTPNSTTAQ